MKSLVYVIFSEETFHENVKSPEVHFDYTDCKLKLVKISKLFLPKGTQ